MNPGTRGPGDHWRTDMLHTLLFLTVPEPWDVTPGPDDPPLLHHLAATPMALTELDDPQPLADDWVVLDTRLCGICGSDSKQVLMDFEDAGEQIGVDISAAEHGADRIVFRNLDLFCEQRCEPRRARAFDDQTIVLHAGKNRARDLFFRNLDDFIDEFLDDRQRDLARTLDGDAVGDRRKTAFDRDRLSGF